MLRLLLALTLVGAVGTEPMIAEIYNAVRMLASRAMPATPVADSLADSLGKKGDAASASGTLHAKVKDLKDNPPSVINSVQRGTISISVANTAVGSATATITSVNTAKSNARYMGVVRDASGNPAITGRAELTNATTVTAWTCGDNGGGYTGVVGYEVMEYK